MENLTVNKVNDILDKLDKAGVEYLEYEGYNDNDYSGEYQSEYIDLFEEIVVNKIFKHFGINPEEKEPIVTFSVKEDGKWVVGFVKPKVIATIEDILSGDYSALKELRTW